MNLIKTIKDYINSLKNLIYYNKSNFKFNNLKAMSESYFLKKDGSFIKNSNFAVVLHLYHKESWHSIFNKKLTHLEKKMNFDLYITAPSENYMYLDEIRKSFPSANFLVVPNRGRDVLPFVKTSNILYQMGYLKVLKIHSKKSVHRDSSDSLEGGDKWLSNTLENLIPTDTKMMNKLSNMLKDRDIGLIGPEAYYYPLSLYFANNQKMLEIISSIIDNKFYENYLLRYMKNTGFFAGTMFWIDLETIKPLLVISKSNFHKEKGQTDGTTAHALERLFCVLPKYSGKKIIAATTKKYIDTSDIKLIKPEWYYSDIRKLGPTISIIVPVYGDWVSLSKNIKSLIKNVGPSDRVNVYFVNDNGPEADYLELKIVKAIKNEHNFHYFRNKKNLGFVKNCNNAVFDIVSQIDDILLLNSDTKVTKGFLSQMQQVLYSNPAIGAVTSRSNNATIWSVPMTSKLHNHSIISYLLYYFIKKIIPKMYISPTIHGFCVLIKRDVIKEFGLFDEIYGLGYGEENDFAMRIRNRGYYCAVANYSFVFHYESRSFGNETRKKQIEKNEKILVSRYPEYRNLVQQYWDSIKEPLK